MRDGNGFYPPEQYSLLWTLLGFLLLLVVVGWFVFVLVRYRRRPQPYLADPLPGFPSGPALQTTYLQLVDDVQRAFRDGTLDSREAHQRLSLVVREFAAQARGVRAQYMTLDDLRATPLTPLSATIGELYPGAFGPEETPSFDAAADRARTLVREWR